MTRDTRSTWQRVLPLTVFALGLGGCSSVLVDDCGAPHAPVNLYSVTGDGAVTLLWTPVDPHRTAEFVVYRSRHLDGPYDVVGFTDADVFVDVSVHNGRTYFYSVSSVSPCGEESVPSHEVAYDTPRPEGLSAVMLDANGSGWRRSGWDFSRARAVPWDAVEADVIFLVDGGVPVVVAADRYTDLQDAGYTGFDEVDWAPAEGWSPTGSAEAIPGHAYVVWTNENHFAKFRVSRAGTGGMIFDWAYQIAEGNPELAPGQRTTLRAESDNSLLSGLALNTPEQAVGR